MKAWYQKCLGDLCQSLDRSPKVDKSLFCSRNSHYPRLETPQKIKSKTQKLAPPRPPLSLSSNGKIVPPRQGHFRVGPTHGRGCKFGWLWSSLMLSINTMRWKAYLGCLLDSLQAGGKQEGTLTHRLRGWAGWSSEEFPENEVGRDLCGSGAARALESRRAHLESGKQSEDWEEGLGSSLGVCGEWLWAGLCSARPRVCVCVTWAGLNMLEHVGAPKCRAKETPSKQPFPI